MSSVYPGALDNFSTAHVDDVDEIIHAATVNDLADAVNKIEGELGTDPSGVFATVGARFAAISGSVPKLYDFTVTGADKASIDTFVDGTTVANFAGYDVLEIWMILRTDDAAATAQLDIRVNNDSSAIYDRHFQGAANTTAQQGAAVAATVWDPRVHGSGGSTGYPSVLRMTFPGYAATVFWKTGELSEAVPDGTAVNTVTGKWSLGYRSTSAITRLKVAAQGASKLKVGSRLIVYAR